MDFSLDYLCKIIGSSPVRWPNGIISSNAFSYFPTLSVPDSSKDVRSTNQVVMQTGVLVWEAKATVNAAPGTQFGRT